MSKFEELFIDPIKDKETALKALGGATALLYLLAALQLFLGPKDGMTLLNGLVTIAFGYFMYRLRSRFIAGCLALTNLDRVITGFPDGGPVVFGGIFFFVLARATWAAFKYHWYRGMTISVENVVILNLVALLYSVIVGVPAFIIDKYVLKSPLFIYVGFAAIIPIYVSTFKGLLPLTKNRPINIPISNERHFPSSIFLICLFGFGLFRFGCSTLLTHHQFAEDFTFDQKMIDSVKDSLVNRPFYEKYGKGKKNRDKRLDQFKRVSPAEIKFLSFETKAFDRRLLEKEGFDSSKLNIETPHRAFIARTKSLIQGKLPPDGRSIRYFFIEVAYDMTCIVRAEVDARWYDLSRPKARKEFNIFRELNFNPFIEYENQKYGFYMKFPQDWLWRLEDMENMGTDLFRIYDPTGECSFAIGEQDVFPVGVQFTDVLEASRLDLDGLLRGLNDRLSRDDQYSNLAVQKVFFAGKEMGEVTVEHRDLMGEWMSLRTLVYKSEEKGKFIFFRYGCQRDKKNVCSAGFDAIEKNWEWGRLSPANLTNATAK